MRCIVFARKAHQATVIFAYYATQTTTSSKMLQT